MSQQQLALESEVSTRHISFVENGRSAPSREMVLLLASALELPLRERNSLLAAAGFAPVYRESALDDPELLHVRQTLDFILHHHEPYPVMVVNRTWDVVKLNAGAMRVFAVLLEEPAEPRIASNVMHATFHPLGLRRYLVNWPEVAGTLLDRLYREAMVEPPGSPSHELLDALRAYPDVPDRLRQVDLTAAPRVSIPLHVRRGDLDLRLLTAITTLGTPLDVTVEELRIETQFPADAATAEQIKRLGGL